MTRRRIGLSRAPAPQQPLADVTAAVLAGGRGTRLGGRDKGLVELAGRPLVAWLLDALRPQVGRVMVSANRNRSRYAELGCEVVGDTLPGYAGPMAGVLSVLSTVEGPYLLVVPGDAPTVPRDLARRLHGALRESAADVAVVHDGRRLQPLYLLLRRGAAPDLAAYLESGGRSALGWLERQPRVVVDLSDRADELFGINTPQDLEVAIRRLDRRATG